MKKLDVMFDRLAAIAARRVMVADIAATSYYDIDWVRQSLNRRVQAIELLVGSSRCVIDIGCNDGRIARRLLDDGHISLVIGIDRSEFRPAESVKGFQFIAGDISCLDIKTLPTADVALCLNVLHHLVAVSVDMTRRVIDDLLHKYQIVVVEMGSFTENVPWDWRRTYDNHWTNDREMSDDLFSHAGDRLAILTSPSQGGGFRTMWRLRKGAGTS